MKTNDLMVLVVYRCYDTQEEESCFVTSYDDAKRFLDTRPLRPEGFESCRGYYFFEPIS